MAEKLPAGALRAKERKRLSRISNGLRYDKKELVKELVDEPTYYTVRHHCWNQGMFGQGPLSNFGFNYPTTHYYFDNYWLAWACSLRLLKSKVQS
jgi:hypothetical protein